MHLKRPRARRKATPEENSGVPRDTPEGRRTTASSDRTPYTKQRRSHMLDSGTHLVHLSGPGQLVSRHDLNLAMSSDLNELTLALEDIRLSVHPDYALCLRKPINRVSEFQLCLVIANSLATGHRLLQQGEYPGQIVLRRRQANLCTGDHKELTRRVKQQQSLNSESSGRKPSDRRLDLLR